MGPTVTRKWRDAALLGVLCLVGLGIKGPLSASADLLSRDGIYYITYAARLRQAPWPYVISHSQQHPMYPLHILAAAEIVQTLTERDDPLSWQFSAQLANLLAGVFLAVPMYYLGKTLFNRSVGFGAALLFQCLPVPARVTADALSEGTFLFWGVTSLLFAVWALRSRSMRWFLLCGLTGGLAFLTRPEGAVIPLAVLLVMLGMLVLGKWYGGWLRALGCAATVSLACLAVVGPYWWAIGKLSAKPSVGRVVVNPGKKHHAAPAGVSEILSRAPGSILLAARLTPGVDGCAEGRVGVWSGFKTTVQEIGKSFYYVLWLPAVIGLSCYRRRMLVDPGLALLALVIVAHCLVLWRLGTTAGYVSERHTLLIILCGLIFAVAAVRHLVIIGKFPFCRHLGTRQWTSLAALGVMLAAALPKTCQPLHGHRTGHKEAGFWLAERLRTDDQIVDPYGWVTFYSGRTLDRLFPTQEQMTLTDCQYLVVEPGDPDLSRQEVIRKGEQAAHGRGSPVFSWPPQRPRVIVYEQHIH